jgi:hypothetical protein
VNIGQVFQHVRIVNGGVAVRHLDTMNSIGKVFVIQPDCVKASSATTGWAMWSWIGNKMVVWDGGAEFWKPDEIIEHISR